MNQEIVVEVNNFLKAIMLGVGFGLIYDTLRILRRIFKRGQIIISVEDVIYWFIMSIIMFIFFYEINGGTIRFYVIVAALIGMLLYEISIGRFYVFYVSKILKFFLNKVSIVLHKIKKILLWALKKCLKPFTIIYKKQKERLRERKIVKEQRRGVKREIKKRSKEEKQRKKHKKIEQT